MLTSTWALSHLSMLSDLTLDMCVPSLRWRAPQRMHKKMPNYCALVTAWRIMDMPASGRRRSWKKVKTGAETYTPACPSCLSSVGCQPVASVGLTWIAHTAVCADAIPGNRLDEVLQGALVARLLALVQGGGHGSGSWCGRESGSVARRERARTRGSDGRPCAKRNGGRRESG